MKMVKMVNTVAKGTKGLANNIVDLVGPFGSIWDHFKKIKKRPCLTIFSKKWPFLIVLKWSKIVTNGPK